MLYFCKVRQVYGKRQTSTRRGGERSSGVAVGLADFLVPESNVHWFCLVLEDERVSKQLRVVWTLLDILCEASVGCEEVGCVRRKEKCEKVEGCSTCELTSFDLS